MPRPLVRDLSQFLASPPPRRAEGKPRREPLKSPVLKPSVPDWKAIVRDADLTVRTAGPGSVRIGGGVELSRTLVERALNQMLRAQRGLEETNVQFAPDGKSFALSGHYRLLGGLVRIPFRLDGRPAFRGQTLRIVVTGFQHPGPRWLDNWMMAKAARETAAQGHPVAWDPVGKAFEMPLSAVLPGIGLDGEPEIRADGPDRLIVATPGTTPAVQGDRQAQVRLDPAFVGDLLARRLDGIVQLDRVVPGPDKWRLEGTLLPGLGAILGPMLPGAREARVPLGLTARATGRHLILTPDVPVKALWEAIRNQIRAKGIPAEIAKEGIRMPVAALSDPNWPLSRVRLEGGQLVAEVGLDQPLNNKAKTIPKQNVY